jgi:UDP-N-acetyl-D-mannosaminuronate dehydrogenase
LPFVIADSIAQRGIKKVGILGLAYKGDIKVHVLSPTLRFVKRLKERGIMVKVNDPYFTPEEIRQIASTDTFEFPEGLREFEAILIVAGHREYRSTPSNIILENLKNCRIVVDNVEETWSKIDFSNYGVEYHVAGDGGWLPVDDNRRIN